MKRIIISVGKDIDFSVMSKFTMKTEEMLDIQKCSFEGDIVVVDSGISCSSIMNLKRSLDYLSNDLGMILNVLFYEDEVNRKILNAVKSCERFFFIEGTNIVSEKEKESVEKNPEIRFIDSDSSSKISRGLYFGLDKIDLIDLLRVDELSLSEVEFTGDLKALEDIVNQDSIRSISVNA